MVWNFELWVELTHFLKQWVVSWVNSFLKWVDPCLETNYLKLLYLCLSPSEFPRHLPFFSIVNPNGATFNIRCLHIYNDRNLPIILYFFQKIQFFEIKVRLIWPSVTLKKNALISSLLTHAKSHWTKCSKW